MGVFPDRGRSGRAWSRAPGAGPHRLASHPVSEARRGIDPRRITSEQRQLAVVGEFWLARLAQGLAAHRPTRRRGGGTIVD